MTIVLPVPASPSITERLFALLVIASSIFWTISVTTFNCSKFRFLYGENLNNSELLISEMVLSAIFNSRSLFQISSKVLR